MERFLLPFLLAQMKRSLQLEKSAYFAATEKDLADFDALDTSAVEPMVYVMPLENILREDESSQPFSRDDLQKGAPEAEDGYWEVPRLIE